MIVRCCVVPCPNVKNKFAMAKIKEKIGIDVSKDTFDVNFIGNDGKEVHNQCDNDAKGIRKFVSGLEKGSEVLMEATGNYHVMLAYALYDAGIRVYVVNPLVIKRYSQMTMMRTKTDKADSRMLRMYLEERGTKHEPWEPDPEWCVKMRQVIGQRDHYNKCLGMTINRKHAMEHSKVSDKLLKEQLDDDMSLYVKRIKACDKELASLADSMCKEDVELVSSIPGIGSLTAMMLVAYTNRMTTFDDSRQLSSYFGLSPRRYDSGTSVHGRARICKMGMGSIRKTLYMCAIVAKTHNRACKELYDRLVAKGKEKKLAVIAVANKLLRQAFAIMKSRAAYDPAI